MPERTADNLTGNDKRMVRYIHLADGAASLIAAEMVRAIADGNPERAIDGAKAAAQTWTNLAEVLHDVKKGA